MPDAASDSVNDISGSGEPSFVHVAICTGTAMDGSGVTLVDRLCLNDPAVRLIDGDMSICQQQQVQFAAIIDGVDKQLQTEVNYGQSLGIAAIVEFLMIMALAVALHAVTRK